MTRILVIERREAARAGVVLEREGFVVCTSLQPHETTTAIASFRPELVLVETTVPHASDLDLCAATRAASAAPIVLLAHSCTERDAIAAFTAGVDMLVREPVGDHELVARVRAQVRRAPRAPEPEPDTIAVGRITLDRAKRELAVDGEVVRLPRREFDIAELLMSNAGRVVSRNEIVRQIWGSLRDTKSLDVQVGRLRMRLAVAEGRRRIVTVRGIGYRLLLDGDPELHPMADPPLETALPGSA
jgi:DNA-binding response OmpR family regulator